MKFKTILIPILFLSGSGSVHCKVWQFGKDAPYSEVLYRGSGTISASEKIKHIHMSIPECHNVKLLRVEVQNFLAHANTTFDEDTNVVTISYKPWQFSESKYDISAKGVRDSECEPLDEENNHTDPNDHSAFSEHL
ncbi:unnamed protein product [Arctia plantaginis]|uniref:Uncharacterized protein n=1 Tax=Arctia plantaginis TaxID=874455 RepID=A0A8S1BFP5_ARCPL|nr:unnamed protein product [Arctia plantaginis]